MNNLVKKVILGLVFMFMSFDAEAMEVAGIAAENWIVPPSCGRSM